MAPKLRNLKVNESMVGGAVVSVAVMYNVQWHLVLLHASSVLLLHSVFSNTLCVLLELGWQVFVIWECALSTASKLPETTMLNQIGVFLSSNKQAASIEGIVSGEILL